MIIYREEIDGLRAIAVIAVILYHAGFRTFFAGGYVGVDIFFVISGYLITSIIIKQYQQQTFSLLHFYERRCRRILPALFFILFLSSPVAYSVMLDDQLKEYGESLISIICISSNVYFWYRDDGYFSRLSELNPLVHTWSLAVEEQFYLIFPLLCYVLINRRRVYLTSVLVCVGLMSLCLCQWGGNVRIKSMQQFQMWSQSAYASFYLPVGRVWELIVGVLAAMYMSSDDDDDSTKKLSSKYNQLLSLLGFILIIISITLFDEHYIPPFPNLYTLLPTLGTALIILYGHKTTFIGYLLSQHLLRWIGLLSYSAYLWHQPLFAFIRLQYSHTLQFSTIVVLIGIIFVLSLFSYLFIEQPFRNNKNFSQNKIFCLSGLCAILLLMIGLFLIRTANDRSLSTNNVKDTYLSDLRHYYNNYYVIRAYDAYVRKKNNCSTTRSTSNRRIVLIGDSYSQDFFNMMKEGKYLTNYEICVHYVSVYCQMYLGNEDRNQFILPIHKQLCTNAHDIKYGIPIIRLANIIILTSRWEEWSAQRLPQTIKLLNLTADQQIYVIGTKNLGVVNPRLYIGKSNKYRIKQYQYPSTKAFRVNDILEKSLDKSIFINIQKMICTGHNDTCPLFTPDGKLISHDGHHLTKYGAIYVGKILFNRKPLNKLK